MAAPAQQPLDDLIHLPQAQRHEEPAIGGLLLPDSEERGRFTRPARGLRVELDARLDALRHRWPLRAPLPPGHRLWLPLPDGDALAATLHLPDSQPSTKPLAVLVHGLTGSEDDPYLRETAAGLLRRGAAVVRWVERHRPSLVVVDVSVEVTLLVRLLGVPVVVVAMQGDRHDRAHRTAYDAATALGVRPGRTRLGAMVIGVALVALVTAAAGPISFIALAAPQIAQRLTRSNTPMGLAPVMLTGAALVVVSDVVAQLVAVPVGVVTWFASSRISRAAASACAVSRTRNDTRRPAGSAWRFT